MGQLDRYKAQVEGALAAHGEGLTRLIFAALAVSGKRKMTYTVCRMAAVAVPVLKVVVFFLLEMEKRSGLVIAMGTRGEGRGGRVHIHLLVLVVPRLATHPSRDGALFLFALETPSIYGGEGRVGF